MDEAKKEDKMMTFGEKMEKLSKKHKKAGEDGK